LLLIMSLKLKFDDGFRLSWLLGTEFLVIVGLGRMMG
jgi:hypothetical protein